MCTENVCGLRTAAQVRKEQQDRLDREAENNFIEHMARAVQAIEKAVNSATIQSCSLNTLPDSVVKELTEAGYIVSRYTDTTLWGCPARHRIDW